MKKISLKSVSDFLSDNQLKRVVGGYGGGSGKMGCFAPDIPECVCGVACTSDSQCEKWHGKGSTCQESCYC